MKKFFLILTAILVVCFAATLASADYISVGDNIKFSYPGGSQWEGPFGITNLTNPSATPKTTFCVESTETFSPGSPYYVNSIGLNIINGGNPAKGAINTLEEGTALLFSKYVDGTLLTSTVSEKNALQAAIYHLQGVGGMYQSGVHSYLYYLDWNGNKQNVKQDDAAWAYYNDNYLVLAATAESDNYYGVRVMNMVDASYGRHQDMLCTVPLPGAVLLLGAGMARLAAYARRRQD